MDFTNSPDSSTFDGPVFEFLRWNLLIISGILVFVVGLSSAFKIGELLSFLSTKHPKGMTLGVLLAAWFFGYSFLTLPLDAISPDSSEEVNVEEVLFVKNLFIFAAIVLLFGPLLLLTPTNPIAIKSDRVFEEAAASGASENGGGRDIVRGEGGGGLEGRISGALVTFLLLQLFVVINLFLILEKVFSDSFQALIIALGYFIVDYVLFYRLL